MHDHVSFLHHCNKDLIFTKTNIFFHNFDFFYYFLLTLIPLDSFHFICFGCFYLEHRTDHMKMLIWMVAYVGMHIWIFLINVNTGCVLSHIGAWHIFTIYHTNKNMYTQIIKKINSSLQLQLHTTVPYFDSHYTTVTKNYDQQSSV